MPWAGPLASDQVLVSPATPASLPVTEPETAPFSATVAVSSPADGVSGVTLRLTVAVDAAPLASPSV